MRVFINILCVILGFCVQASLCDFIKINIIKPDIIILFIISSAILRSDLEAVILGFFFGLMRDIFFGKLIGIFALSYMLIGYLASKPFKYFYNENYFIPMILCFTTSFLFDAIIFFKIIFSQDINYYFYFIANIILPKAIYNTLLIFIFYPVVYFINIKLLTRESKHGFKI